MIPDDIKYYYIGKSGVREKAIKRDDGKISDRYIRLINIEYPKFLDTYIEIIIWDIDNRVDIKAEKKPLDPRFSILFDHKRTSYKYNDDSLNNLFELSTLTEAGFHAWTLDELNAIVNGSIITYFKEKSISIVKKSIGYNSYQYYAKHQYYSDSEIFEIYKVCVLCPLLNSAKQSFFIQTNQKKIQANNESTFRDFKRNVIAFFFVVLFFTGCFTMMTRKRIGCDCNDGTDSYATGSGACSHHDGVKSWKYEYWWDK